LKIICRKWVLEAAEKYIKRDGWKLTLKEARFPRWAVEPVVNLRRVPETKLGRKTRAAFSSN
jgi:hypothetical protein